VAARALRRKRVSSRFLQLFIDEASFSLAELAPRLRSQQAGQDHALELCRQFRRRGIASLLLLGEAGSLHRDLQRSGAAYADYLVWAKDEHKTASKAVPFFDAVASGDATAAALIASRTAADPRREEEYEDDFIYMRWLMGRFYLQQSEVSLDPMLERYEVLLDGAEDARAVVCQALRRADPAKFDTALQTLIEQREDDYASGIDADQILEEEWATEGKVFVEGIALLRFAAQLGLPIQRDYLFIPSLAMRSAAAAQAADSWSNPNAP
jgi:hypothetical protein